ncbi:MAG: hypothetical protein KIT87_02510 [Anaerolineae bacterium]|nr:hypothetical protein [Anaerolineae bacterium]
MTRNSTLKVAVLAASVLAVLLVAALLLTNGDTVLASPAAQATGTVRAATVVATAVAPAATARPAATATAVRPAALPTTGDANTGGPNWLLLVGGALLVAGLMALLTLGNRAPQRR